MSQFNVQQQHPLIPREQTYVLDRKLVSIHSYDRDIKKWPNSNYFEIDLPQSLQNIQSMRLLNISLPSNQYVFSNEYQNTQLRIEVSDPLTPSSPSSAGPYTITISEGSYSPDQLATEVETKINKAIATQAQDNTYNNIICKYNSVTNQFWFGSINGVTFTLLFGDKLIYQMGCNQVNVWSNYTRWGLPAYLGYKKSTYVSTPTPANPWFSNMPGDPFGFDYEVVDGSGEEWLDLSGNNNIVNLNNLNANACDPSGIGNLDIMGDDYIYMQIEKYNSMDEIEPYSENTGGLCNNDYGGKVNGSFAKIPVRCLPFAQVFDTTRMFIANISHYSPPIERLDRLRFKFRYHDGRLIDFKCLPFTFTLEFNMLRDEQVRSMLVRVPPLYCL
jgi:hypothetical protein